MARIILLVITAVCTQSAWSDWPQFRGPNCSGVATGDYVVEFSPGVNELWQLPLQSGHSSPCVSGDVIFLTEFNESKRELSVVCIDKQNGVVRWRRKVDAPDIERGHPSFNPASSTPAADGERVVAYFGSFGLVCFDYSGKQLWDIPMPVTKSYAGNATSPIIADNMVILYRGNQVDHFLLAVDKNTGSQKWKVPQSEPFHMELACTAVPIVAGNQLIVHSARSVQGFDLMTGQQRWVTKCATTATSSPIMVGGRVVVAAWNKMGEPALRPQFPSYDELLRDHDANDDSQIQRNEFPRVWIFHRPEGVEAPQNGAPIGFRHVDQDQNGSLSAKEWNAKLEDFRRFRQGYQTHGLISLPLNSIGVLQDSETATLETQGIPEVPSPVSDGRYIYLAKNGGQVTCIDTLSSERVYRKRTGGKGTHYASPIIAGEHLYIADGNGGIAVMTLGPRPNVVAKNQMGDRVFASPAASDNVLYIRTHNALFAFGRTP